MRLTGDRHRSSTELGTTSILGVLVEQAPWRVAAQLGAERPVANVLYAAPIQDALAEFDLAKSVRYISPPVSFKVQDGAQAKRVDVSKSVGRRPPANQAQPFRGRRTMSKPRPRPADFLTIRIRNISDLPVYDLAIVWRRFLRREGEPDRLKILRPGEVKCYLELPGPARDPQARLNDAYDAVVYFRDANGIGWRAEPDKPPREVRWKWPGPWPPTD